MARLLPNFIDGYSEYLDNKGAPKLFVKWAAIFTVAAALERKVWIEHELGKSYPGQYILLTGPAGVGKGLCLNTTYDLLSTLQKPKEFYIAPTSVSKASLMDALHAAERCIIRPMETPSTYSFNSVTAIPNEFGVFLPGWDSEFMNVLTDIWDHRRYTETRRTRAIEIDVPNAQINLLSGTTPAYLSKFLPEGAWEEGFMSRTLIIYSGESYRIDIFAKQPGREELWNKLVHDIKEIHKLFGQMQITDDFVDAVHEWGRKGRPPQPTHPKLAGYSTRREAHLLKLIIVAAAAQDDELILTREHFATALDWLTQAEFYMPDVFKAISTGGDMQVMEDCWYMCMEYFMKHQKPIAEHLVVAFLQPRTPAHNIQRLIEIMCLSTMLKKQFTDTGGIGYEPKGKG